MKIKRDHVIIVGLVIIAIGALVGANFVEDARKELIALASMIVTGLAGALKGSGTSDGDRK